MSKLKDERLANALRELAAEYVNLESSRTSLITITRAEVEGRGRYAKIYFTVFPDNGGEPEKVLEFLQRKQSDFRKFVNNKKIVAFAPTITFLFDLGEKNRQRIDELSNLDTKS